MDSSPVGGRVPKRSLGLYLLYKCNERTLLSGEQDGNWVCSFAVKLHLRWLLDQAFLILHCELYPPVNDIMVCLYYAVNYRQV